MDYTLSDLIDVKKNQVLMNSFSEAVNIPTGLIDLEGNVLIGAKWQRICTDFHRKHTDLCKRCIESDTELALKLKEGEKFSIYKCKNGLVDAASPVIVDGKHLANFFIGQFLTEPPDVEYFKRQAQEFGLNEEEYLKALSEVPIIPEERLMPIMNFLISFAETIASMGLDRLKQEKSDKELKKHREHLEEMIEERTKKLKESEEKFRIIADYTYDWESWIDQNGKLIWTNPAVERISGFTVSECMSMENYPQDLFYSEDHDELMKNFKIALEGKSGNDVPLRIQKKNRDIVWVSISWNPVYDIKRKFLGFRSSARDFTDRKLAEEEKKKQTDMLNITLEALAHPFYVIDANTYEIILANVAARNLSMDGNITTCHVLTHRRKSPCNGGLDPCPLEAVKKTKKPVKMNHTHYDSEGNEIYVEVHGYPIFNDDGEVIQMIEYSLNITDRRKMELEIERKLEELERFQKLTVDRELKMINLKQEVNGLLGQAGQQQKYKIVE